MWREGVGTSSSCCVASGIAGRLRFPALLPARPDVMIKKLLGALENLLPGSTRSRLLSIAIVALIAGDAIWSYVGGTYGPYEVIGYNYADRDIAGFFVDGQGVGSSYAHESGGGGGIFCCHSIPKHAKTLHIKVVLGLTKEQYEKDLPNDAYQIDMPVPALPDKHDGFIEFHFLPNRRVEAAWVKFPTIPHIPNAH